MGQGEMIFVAIELYEIFFLTNVTLLVSFSIIIIMWTIYIIEMFLYCMEITQTFSMKEQNKTNEAALSS